MAGAGELNVDGYADIAVGALRYDTVADGGAAFVFYAGSAEGLSPLASQFAVTFSVYELVLPA